MGLYLLVNSIFQEWVSFICIKTLLDLLVLIYNPFTQEEH